MACDFERVMRAVAALNARPTPSITFGRLSVRYLHWGVTPPAWWRSPRHPNPCEIHKHPYYEVCHALDGRGTFHTHTPPARRDIAAGDTFFARPDLLHCYGGRKGAELGIVFWSFEIERGGEPLQSAAPLAAFASSEQTFVPSDATTRAILELIFDEALGAGCVRPLLEYLTAHLARVASDADWEVPEHAPASAPQASTNVLGKACQFVQDHCHRDVRMEELARRCGYSRRHLARLFRESPAGSFTAYLAQARIQTACHLLLNENVPLKQVARRAGFGSLPAFTRAFKRHSGVTPGDYRTRSLGASR